jgi:type VI secretion system protein ImpF
MAELTPLEKLQPCLLDRLTDDDPTNSEESRNQRVVPLPKYKRGVLRDLEWLFNSSAHLPQEEGGPMTPADFPAVRDSVLNFGTRQLCGLVGPDLAEFERELVLSIQRFEPRILRNSLTVTAVHERQLIHLEIRGTLWANPVPERLFIKTRIDLETGQTMLGDAGNG